MYKNTVHTDLWESLTENAVGMLPENSTVQDIMDEWVVSSGFPVVHVLRSYNDGNKSVLFSQVDI